MSQDVPGKTAFNAADALAYWLHPEFCLECAVVVGTTWLRNSLFH